MVSKKQKTAGLYAQLTSNRSLAILSLAAFGLLASLMLNGQPPRNFVPMPEQVLSPISRPSTGGTVRTGDEAAGATPYRTTNDKTANATANAGHGPTHQNAKLEARPFQRPATQKFVTINDKQYPLRTYQPLAVPNDPSANQWWTSNAKLPQAWDTAPPNDSPSTILAVIDTGFALKHEEFANRWHSNPGESGPTTNQQPSQRNCSDRGLPLSASCNLIDEDADGIIDNETGPAIYQNPSRLNCSDRGLALDRSCNRIDDDGNGYVDDVTGWDFASNDNLPQAGELNPNGSGTHHGTQVAAIAAATGNNGKGIAGVDWQTKLLPIQALDDDSYGNTLGVGRAIHYAIDQGADVISLSLGSTLPDDYVREAIQAATAAGIVVVAAAGNDGCDCMVYPANYPEVLAVGALDTNDLPAGFNSYGPNLDVLAPGTQMATANWTASNQISAYSGSVNGTSFATPLVSGLLTRLLRQQPSAKPLQLMAALTENTNRLHLGAAARSNTLGYGTVDAAKATSRMATGRNLAQAYSLTPISRGDQLPSFPASEVVGNYFGQACEPEVMGTTPVYELTRAGGASIFSLSPTESWLATSRAGYQSRLFAHVCLSQPHDRPTAVRVLDINREFRNLTGH